MADHQETRPVTTPTQPTVADCHVRRRYSAEELLQGAELIPKLNKGTRWAREGEPVGREIT
jgi:hypothetical protein